jgi:hypothetical protein
MASLMGTPTRIEAGAFFPCERPYGFKGAAVNVMILQCYYTGGGGPLSVAGKQLSQMIQLDMLFSLVKYESIAVEHLNRVSGIADPECSEQAIVEKLFGTRPGAEGQIQPAGGLVVLSGRIYEEGNELFIRSQLRFLRRGISERMDVATPASGSPALEFTGKLPYQGVMFPPRRITRDDLSRIEAEYRRSLTLRSEPNEQELGRPLPVLAGTMFAYQVDGVRGDWLKISSPTGEHGWVRARVDPRGWPLREKLPELSFVDGVVGYLEYRIGSTREGSRSRVKFANDSFQEYERTEGQSESGRLSVPLATEKSLKALLAASAADSRPAGMETASTLYRQATELVPYNAATWNLTAISELYLCCLADRTSGNPSSALKDLLNAVAADPGNDEVLSNLENLYILLTSSPNLKSPFAPSELSRRIIEIKAVRSRKAEAVHESFGTAGTSAISSPQASTPRNESTSPIFSP